MFSCLRSKIRSLLGQEPDLTDWYTQYEAIFANLPVGIAFLTSDMRYIRINSFLEKRFSLRSEDLVGKHCYDVVGMYRDDPTRQGEERICDVCGVRVAIETGKPFKFTRKARPDLIVDNMGVPILNSKGEVVGAAEIIMDVTERVSMEEKLHAHARELEVTVDEKTRELRRSRSFLNNIIESTKDAIFTMDSDGCIGFMNNSAGSVFGQNAGSLKNVRLSTLLNPADADKVVELFNASGDKAVPVYNVKVKLAKERGGGDLLLSISPLSYHDADNQFVCICKDITNECKLEQEKEEFVAMLTHDLKTPLTSILGYSALILNEDLGKVTDAVRLSVDGIRMNGEKMMGLVRNFLDLGRIDGANMSLNAEPVSVEDMLNDCLKSMRPVFDEKGINTITGISPGLPRIFADRQLMDRVVGNLLSNAVRFTSSGGHIEVRAYHSDDGHVTVEVSDTGEGLPDDELEYLFDKYYQGSRGSATGGTGLGLYISKSIVEAHQGRITAHNRPGSGATFTVKIPMMS